MGISKEEAMAELKRRGVPIPAQFNQQQPKRSISKEEAMAELKRRGVAIPEQNRPWYQHPLMSAATGFNKGIEDVTHGILQPALESGYLGENVKRGSQEVAQGRGEQFREHKRLNPKSAALGNILGTTAISLPVSAASGGAGAFAKAPGFMKYLNGILSGGLTGAATGASEYVNPGESRLKNAAMGAAVGGGLGALGSAVAGGKNTASAIGKAYPAEKVAGKILEDRNVIRNQYQNAYQGLFKEAEDAGINAVKIPKINTSAIKQNTTSKEFKAVENFLEKPTLEHAHRAQSDLGRTIRRLEKTHEGVGLNTAQQEALEAALSAQKRIRGSMFDAFSKKGDQGLASRYGELTTGYAKDVLPYTKSKPINAYRKGELTDKDFLKSLGTNKKFQKQLGEKYPELETRKNVGSAVNKLLGAGTTAGAIEALHLLGVF